jgi:hypothetical protein
MNRTNSLIILGAIMLSTFLVFNTAITMSLFEVYADAAAGPREAYYETIEEERSYDDYSSSSSELDNEEGYSSPMMNDYYTQQGPPPSMMMAEEGKGEYNPDRYGGYYGHYEGDFYLDQYNDGNPYDGIDGPYNSNNDDDDNPYDNGNNGSPYILG